MGLRARNAGGESGWVYSATPAALALSVAEPNVGFALLDFFVTLNRAASGAVTVDYATGKAGDTAQPGTLPGTKSETDGRTLCPPVRGPTNQREISQ